MKSTPDSSPKFLKSDQIVAIEGPLGVGKTSLVRLLSAKWSAPSHFEVFEENPFLTGGFYENQKSLAFNTEIFFLLSRFRQQRGLIDQKGIQICDYIFPKSALFAQMNLEAADFEIFSKVYEQLMPQLKKPSLVVYLHADIETLLRRIYFRDRKFERAISSRYVESLVQSYHRFFANYTEVPMISVDTTTLDFVTSQNDFRKISALIEERLSGQVQLSLIGDSRERLREAHA